MDTEYARGRDGEVRKEGKEKERGREGGREKERERERATPFTYNSRMPGRAFCSDLNPEP